MCQLSQNAMATPSASTDRSPTGDSSAEVTLPSYVPDSDATPTAAVEAIREGLPAEAFDWLKEELDLTTSDLAEVVQISRRTVSRRKKEGRLKPGESERVLRLIRLYQRAAEVVGGRGEARKWMQEPNRALGGSSPLQFADTEPGARRVERLLGQIEHGVFT